MLDQSIELTFRKQTNLGTTTALNKTLMREILFCKTFSLNTAGEWLHNNFLDEVNKQGEEIYSCL